MLDEENILDFRNYRWIEPRPHAISVDVRDEAYINLMRLRKALDRSFVEQFSRNATMTDAVAFCIWQATKGMAEASPGWTEPPQPDF